MKRLAADSLDRLRAALPRQAADFPALFHLDAYATVVGSFELNNLNVMVENPMENYFLYVDALEGEERERATAVTCAPPRRRRPRGPGAYASLERGRLGTACASRGVFAEVRGRLSRVQPEP